LAIMAQENQKDKEDLQPAEPAAAAAGELDAASRSLSEALGISFIVLKLIMIVLVGLFLFSGFKTVGPDEQAIVLRFGKIRGEILEPRGMPYWVFPYPIEEIIKIPVAKKVPLNILSFWYYQSEEDLIEESQGRSRPPRSDTLDPLKDGYCITRSQEQSDGLRGSDGSDYNIVHTKWQFTYQIARPEIFFRNVYVEDAKPGEIYFDVIKKSIEPLLQDLFEDVVVTTMVNYTIDEVLSASSKIPDEVEGLLRTKLREIESGIEVTLASVLLTNKTWPRQVDDAFQASHKASQERQKAISEARTYAQNILNEAAGQVAEQLFAALQNDSASEQTKELLWSQLAGTAQEKLFEARAYRSEVVDNARGSADYLQSLLPEYRKRPELVIQSIYRDATEEILGNVDEKFILQPTQGAKGTEVRILVNRDPTIKRKSRARETQQD